MNLISADPRLHMPDYLHLDLIFMRMACILVFVSFLVLIWFNKLWMQSKFSRTVASLAVLMAMIFGEASK